VGRVVKESGKTVIEIFPKYRDAALGLEGFSHVIVLYWFDRNDTPKKRSILRVHPRGNPKNPLRGVFATRSPARPNLIGLSLCKIISIDDAGIVVNGIDAFHNSPVIDIKPHIPGMDCIRAASGSRPPYGRPGMR
jgi:tRNA-Thr(GGU) m(6)t(6)A37 methyltransferase TsaA